jgi:hypothetical protein
VFEFVKPGARVGLEEYDPVCTVVGATVKPQKASNSAGVEFVLIASSRNICVRKAIGGMESNKGLAA